MYVLLKKKFAKNMTTNITMIR